MAYPQQQINTGSFVPITNVWDVSQVYEINVNSPEFKELLVRLYQNINNIAQVLNSKDSAFYLNEEFVTSQLYYNPASNDPLMLRPGFRITVNTGALGAGTTAVNHGLAVTNTWKWMSIVGAGTDTVNTLGYPITFGGASNNSIEVSVNATQVVINNQSGVVFTDSSVTLEYVKY